MEDYKPNSHAYKEAQKKKTEKPKMEKVITGTATVRKKSAGRKFADVFISEDVTNVKSYILTDVLVPAVKKLVADIVQDGIEMILYGGSRRGEKRSGFRADNVSYSSYYRNDKKRYDDNRTRSGYSYDDIVLPTRTDAEAVLNRLDECLDSYGQVTVGDLYDSVGITGEYTDERYGWLSLSGARVERVRDGYLIRLPKALPIDK